MTRLPSPSPAELDAFIQQGIDDLDAGRFAEHEEVMAELDEMIARLEAKAEAVGEE